MRSTAIVFIEWIHSPTSSHDVGYKRLDIILHFGYREAEVFLPQPIICKFLSRFFSIFTDR